MSRSYREPWFVDGYGGQRKRWMKRYANKTVRKAKDVPPGKAYRRFYDPWNIVDWKYRWDPDGYIWWKNGEPIWEPPSPEWKARRK